MDTTIKTSVYVIGAYLPAVSSMCKVYGILGSAHQSCKEYNRIRFPTSVVNECRPYFVAILFGIRFCQTCNKYNKEARERHCDYRVISIRYMREVSFTYSRRCVSMKNAWRKRYCISSRLCRRRYIIRRHAKPVIRSPVDSRIMQVRK